MTMDKIETNKRFCQSPYNKGLEVTDGQSKLIPPSESSTAISIDYSFLVISRMHKRKGNSALFFQKVQAMQQSKFKDIKVIEGRGNVCARTTPKKFNNRHAPGRPFHQVS